MQPDISSFVQKVYSYYFAHSRDMPWRYISDPYKILVSEIMLQQTQVERVIPKFLSFTQVFPTVQSLACASSVDVLRQWQGLGYNRRGIYLKKAAEIIVEKHIGIFPSTVDEVDQLPGVGFATACAVITYSYNIPTVFIETNIRTVFIHTFFPDRENVHDNEILPLVTASLDSHQPREWYYALMDYGVMLKKEFGNASRKSKHYATQSRFAGSDRQLRGKIVKYILQHGPSRYEDLIILDADSKKSERVITSLLKDSLLTKDHDRVHIKE